MSNSLAQANSKRRSGNINELPDAILHHILSFLPTKEAIATSILSTRWLFVWTSVPVLDFEDSRRCKTNEEHRTAFADFVSRALILNRMGSLDKFRLQCYSLYGPSRLNTWISDAIQRDFVREIDISIYDFDYFKLDFFRLPSSFFIKNLKVLKLSHGILIDIPNNTPVCFPSLKILHLVFIDYSNGGSASSLLRGCPVLEELLIKRRSDGDEVKIFNISVPTLKTLSYTSYLREPSWPELNIYAPMLEYLNLNIDDDDERYLVYLESDFNNIIKANVSFDEAGISQLARALCNAKFLSLKCIRGMDKSQALTLPSFPNLTQLELRIGFLDRDVILHFLENTPKLEVLVLDYEEILTSAARETDERDFLPRHSSPCLKKVYIRGFGGYRHELEMVKYILKNSRALKLIEICSSASILDSKFHMLQKLSEIPRHSEACQLKFK